MPFLQELLDTLKFTRLVGQQPFGHYDHNATCIIGPPSCEDALADPALPKTSEECSEQSPVLSYEQFVEPRTGEVLYKLVR
jgi:hypothetical protein